MAPIQGGIDQTRPFLFYYLMVTAMVCGALVMVIEIMGSRVIGPFFGASIFVWTSLITLTLVALAAGYAAGGIVSDRKPSPAFLYGGIFFAGVLTMLIPFLKPLVLTATVSLGLRIGSFASSVALFGIPLFLLGCVSPYLVKIAAKEMMNIGRTVGVFYAISTVGSVLGTVLTGFFLIAYLGVNSIFMVTGALLIVLASGYFLIFRHSGYALMVLVLPLLLHHHDTLLSKVMADGSTMTKVFSLDTYYGNLKVIDQSYGNYYCRHFLLNGICQSAIDVNNHMPLQSYAYFLEFLPYGINPTGRKCLVLGLGAGVVPVWYEQNGIRTDVVDIDPHVVAIARKYFDFSVSGDVIIQDARYYLSTSVKQYDYIILDVFNGDTIPSHLLSIEMLKLVRERMTEHGILAINIVGSLKKNNFMSASIIKTVRQTFKTVNVYPIFDPAEGKGFGNIIIIAYDAAFPPFEQKAVTMFRVHSVPWAEISKYLGRACTLPADTPAVTLTDDYNPVDLYDVEVKEWMTELSLKYYSADFLL